MVKILEVTSNRMTNSLADTPLVSLDSRVVHNFSAPSALTFFFRSEFSFLGRFGGSYWAFHSLNGFHYASVAPGSVHTSARHLPPPRTWTSFVSTFALALFKNVGGMMVEWVSQSSNVKSAMMDLLFDVCRLDYEVINYTQAGLPMGVVLRWAHHLLLGHRDDGWAAS
jgi:hypothetical protein